jgi:hypothetical protein
MEELRPIWIDSFSRNQGQTMPAIFSVYFGTRLRSKIGRFPLARNRKPFPVESGLQLGKPRKCRMPNSEFRISKMLSSNRFIPAGETPAFPVFTIFAQSLVWERRRPRLRACDILWFYKPRDTPNTWRSRAATKMS